MTIFEVDNLYLLARAPFLIGYIVLGLPLLAGLLWGAWQLGQWSARRESQTANALNAVMAATVLRRSRSETLGRILEETTSHLQATSGCIHLVNREGRGLGLVHATGIERLDLLTDLSPRDGVVSQLNSADDEAIVAPLDPESPWAAMSAGRWLTLLAVRLGGRTRPTGLMVLGWPTRRETETNISVVTSIAHYASQVLTEYDEIERRAGDLHTLSVALQRSEALARTAAHDLANKFIAARGLLSSLAEAEQDEHGTLLQDSLAQMNLIEAMLEDFQSPDRPIEPERVPVEELIKLAAGMMARHQADSPFEFSLTVPPGLPDLWGERVGILRVLDNLLANAIRHNADCPQLNIWLNARQSEGWIEFEVGDDGVGISEEARSQLFEFGYRADSTGKVKGHGMGLWSCRRIVEAHGGRIWVESEMDRGSRFMLTLPTVQECTPSGDTSYRSTQMPMTVTARELASL